MEVGSTIYMALPTSNIYIIMNCLETQVSLYKDAYDKNGEGTIDLFGFLNSEEFKEEITKIRSLKDANEVRKHKLALPCITPSGIFNKRGSGNLISHSGLIGIDIDAKDNSHITNFNAIGKDLIKIPNIAYCGRSVYSGYFLVIPISTSKEHRGQFLALNKLFKEQFSIIIDSQCGNVDRLRAISYDPNRYFNFQAVPFSTVLCDEKNYPELQLNKPLIKTGDIGRLYELVEQISNSGLDITGNGYDWWQIGCAIANILGEEGQQVFHVISQFYDNDRYRYSPQETDRKYDQCLNNKTRCSIGTVIWYYKKAMRKYNS